MIPRRAVIAASLAAATSVSLPLTSNASPTAPGYDSWTGTTWTPLTAAPTDDPAFAWERDIPAGGAGDIELGVIVVAEATMAGEVVVSRIDPASGEPSWTIDLPGGDDVTTEIGGAGSEVVVGVRGVDDFVDASVLDLADGHVIWQGSVLAAPEAARHGNLLVLSGAGDTLAVDIASGAEVWRVDAPVNAYDTALLAMDGDALDDPPTIRFGVVDAASGAVRWEHERGRMSSPTVIGDTVVLTRHDGTSSSAAGYDVVSGELRWDVGLPPVGFAGAWPLGKSGVVIAGADDPDAAIGTIVVLDAATGATRWQSEYGFGNGFATWRVDDRQFLMTRDRDNAITIRDADTGAILIDGDRGHMPTWPVATASGQWYMRDPDLRDTIIGVDMTSLQWRWGIDIVESDAILPVDGGFVAWSSNEATRSVTLTAYLGNGGPASG